MTNSSLLIFPTARAVREYIDKSKSKNQLLQKTITIGEFFQLSVQHKNHKYLVDKNLKILYLKEAIVNANIEKLGFSRDFGTFLKQSEYIFRFFLETSNEYVDFDKFLEYDTYGLYNDHLEILKEVYKNYVKLLDEAILTDNILMPLEYKINLDYIKQFKSITIYLEGYLSGFEFKIIKDISKEINCFINITFNVYNKKNFNLFTECKVDLKLDYTYLINLSQNEIITSTPRIILTRKKTIESISSQLEQIGFIKYQITNMIKDGISPEKIVVITPDERTTKILALFDNEKYFNFAMGRGIQDNKIFEVIRLINKMMVDQEPKDIVKFKFLEISEDIFVKVFKNNWNNNITNNIFNDIIEFLFSFETNADVFDKLNEAKIIFESVLFSSGYDVKVKEFIKLFQKQISAITIDDVYGGKITVLGILETRAISYEGVIVIDFNDDKIPKISVKDKFISTNLKQNVNLPTSVDRENLQRYYYKRILDNAASIALCFVDNDVAVMSRFIVDLYPNYKDFLSKKDYKSILYSRKILDYYHNEIEIDIDLSLLSWSATSLKTFLTCKRQYYFAHIRNIKNHNISIKPESFEIGNIIHNGLEEAVKTNNFNIIFLNNYLTSFQKSNPYLILELELWKKKLIKFFEFEKIREQNGIKIHNAELVFEFKHHGVKLNGKIDRIDKYPDDSYEILDYKTSASLKIDNIKNYEDTVDFQLEFYKLANSYENIRAVGYYDLNDSSIKSEVVIDEKLKLLDLHLLALKTTKVDFKQTDKISDCLFCPYKIICNRAG